MRGGRNLNAGLQVFYLKGLAFGVPFGPPRRNAKRYKQVFSKNPILPQC